MKRVHSYKALNMYPCTELNFYFKHFHYKIHALLYNVLYDHTKTIRQMRQNITSQNNDMHFEGELPNLMTVKFSRYMVSSKCGQYSKVRLLFSYFKMVFLKKGKYELNLFLLSHTQPTVSTQLSQQMLGKSLSKQGHTCKI